MGSSQTGMGGPWVPDACTLPTARWPAFAQGALSGAIGRLAQHLPRISGALLAACGLYLAIYWIPALVRRGTASGADPLSAVSTWIGAYENLVTAGAAVLVITAVIATVPAAGHEAATGGAR